MQVREQLATMPAAHPDKMQARFQEGTIAVLLHVAQVDREEKTITCSKILKRKIWGPLACSFPLV